jgi:hypothetical protein
MLHRVLLSASTVGLLLIGSSLHAQDPGKSIPRGAKVFIAQMEDGFADYLSNAIQKKKVPILVVKDKSDAQFEITGHSESVKASAAKKLIMSNFHSDEQASISIANLSSGEVVYAYSANKKSSAHGKQTTAEACAKHLKEFIEKK